LHENSETNYFTIGAKPVGLCSETTAILVSASESSLAPLVELLRVSMMVTIYMENNSKMIEMFSFQDQEKEDGVTSTGKLVVDPKKNTDGEKCAMCEKVGESLLVCTVSCLAGKAIPKHCCLFIFLNLENQHNLYLGRKTIANISPVTTTMHQIFLINF
jgi:hypothetical protein